MINNDPIESRHFMNILHKTIKNYSFFLFFIEFIGVTLVNKIMQVSGTKFYHTPSVAGFN